jgi:hypothetical protein
MPNALAAASAFLYTYSTKQNRPAWKGTFCLPRFIIIIIIIIAQMEDSIAEGK